MKVKKKQIIVTALLIAVCLVTLIGSSYALFTKTLSSTKKISVQAGTLKVDFAEGNRINLLNVAPMSDSDGMNTTPYTFTITNSGSVAAYYTIRNEEDSSNTLNNKYIKYRLISDNYDSGIKTLDTMGSGYYILSSENTLAVGKSITYKLYLWLSSEANNDAQNKTYQSKIVVQSTTNSISDTVATTLLKGVGDKGSIDASDPEQTFITGTDPNNYIWYSGKLWRAVSIDSSDNSVKIMTQWNVASINNNNSNNSEFKNSYVEQWLNDTTVDGFLGNLREPEKFIKTDSVWNATMTTEITKPAKTTMIKDTVGLINLYEYIMTTRKANTLTGYLKNNLIWIVSSPYASTKVNYIDFNGGYGSYQTGSTFGIRPVVNLKSNIKVVSGNGTSNDPYRLEGDIDSLTTGTLLSTRYSGEYIRFGIGENNLYRIVSHENGTGTKIVSDVPLKVNGKYKELQFDSNGSINYSINTTVGTFLNGEFLNDNSFLSNDQINMIDNSTWYLGSVAVGGNYKLAKYTDTTASNITTNTTLAKVGLLRVGEFGTGQFNGYYRDTINNWTLTPVSESSKIRHIDKDGTINNIDSTNSMGIKPAMNLKSNVVITGGDGTKNNPFTVALQ